MCDFAIMEKALKIAWINRLQNQSSASWKIIPNHLLQRYGNFTFLISCNYDMKTLTLDNLPDFYHSILEYWQYFKMLSINETDIKDEVLWNNRNILIDKKPVFYRNWFSKNIIHLHHLLNDHGKFYAFDEFKTKYNLDAPLLFSMVLSKPFLVRGKVNLNDAVKLITSSIRTIKYVHKIYLRDYLKKHFCTAGFAKQDPAP